MELTNEQYEKLMRFLDGEMEYEEVNVFEKELDNNPALMAQLNLEQNVRMAFYTNEKDSNKNEALSSTNKKPVIVFPLSSMVAAAALLVLIAMVSFYLIKSNAKTEISLAENTEPSKQNTNKPVTAPADNSRIVNNSSADSLFKLNYSKPAVPVNYPVILAEALLDYENNHYAAIEKFNTQQLPQVRSGENENKKIIFLVHFYKGIALLEKEESNTAIENFKKAILIDSNNDMNDEAHWYLSLAYLKNKDIGKTINQLQYLTGNDMYTKKAVALLKYLNLSK